MSIRIILFSAIWLSGICLTISAQQPPASPAQKNDADSSEVKASTISFLACKYINSTHALKMLNDVLGPMKSTRIVADPSRNILFVQGPDTSIAIRVIWLTNAQIPHEMATENDTKLQQIIDRLAKQGIKNLAIGMQLLSRCDPSSGTPGKCKVSGIVDLKDNSQELFVESNFNQVQSTKVFSGHIEIRATRTPLAGAVSTSTVQVDVNAEPEKYYVLSSSPIGSHHSVFVVQLLDDF